MDEVIVPTFDEVLSLQKLGMEHITNDNVVAIAQKAFSNYVNAQPLDDRSFIHRQIAEAIFND